VNFNKERDMGMITVSCIDCQHPLALQSKPVEGEIIVCTHCGVELEVINVEPVELDWLYLEPMEREAGWERWPGAAGKLNAGLDTS